MIGRLRSRTPPPPHAPGERVLLTHVDGWEVRDFAVDDVKRVYFARFGFAHLQLWHPRGVSVLTPSRLTAMTYEVYPIRGWKHREREWARLGELLRAETSVTLPSTPAMRALERWFGRLTETEALVGPRLPRFSA